MPRWMIPFLLLCAGCPAMPMMPSSTPSSQVSSVVPTSGPLAALRSHPVELTRHGRCRMQCRHISEAEVHEILHGAGRLDPSRTRTDGRCPSYALEGRTSDGQQVRIVFAGCDDATRVVTAIDLGKKWPCGEC